MTVESAARFENGRALAASDIDKLWSLAERIAADVSTWSTVWRTLDVGRDGAFPSNALGGRLVECLFDDALTPPAARVLATAVEVALCGVTQQHRADERGEDR